MNDNAPLIICFHSNGGIRGDNMTIYGGPLHPLELTACKQRERKKRSAKRDIDRDRDEVTQEYYE